MTDTFAIIVFGWPFIILSLLVSLIGLLTKRALYLLIAAVLILPFSFYLMGDPYVRGWSLALPVCLIASSLALRYQMPKIGWLFFSAPLALVVWLAIIVLTQ